MVVVVEERVRDAGYQEREIVVGAKRGPSVVRADEGVEPVDGQVAPVRVVVPFERRPLVVLLGLDGLGDRRVAAVGTDDDRRLLGDVRPAGVMAADAGDAPVVVGDQVLDDELLAHLGTGVGGGIDEDLVEHGSTRRVRLGHAVEGLRRSRQLERPEVERVRGDGWATGRTDGVEQTPALERGDARRVDEVRGDGVAREHGPVDDQHPVSLPGEQHGCG